MYIKNNFVNSQYYSNYDLLNKYNLTSLYNKPKIKKIIIEMSLTEFLNSLDNEQEQGRLNEMGVQIKIFSLFYCWLSVFPFITNCKSNLLKNKQKESPSYTILKTIFSKNEQIDNFLISIFVENWINFINEDIKISSESSNFSSLLKKKGGNRGHVLSNFKLSLPFSVLFDIDKILSNISNFNSKELTFNINIVIFNPKSIIQNKNNILKNLPIFWING